MPFDMKALLVLPVHVGDEHIVFFRWHDDLPIVPFPGLMIHDDDALWFVRVERVSLHLAKDDGPHLALDCGDQRRIDATADEVRAEYMARGWSVGVRREPGAESPS